MGFLTNIINDARRPIPGGVSAVFARDTGAILRDIPETTPDFAIVSGRVHGQESGSASPAGVRMNESPVPDIEPSEPLTMPGRSISPATSILSVNDSIAPSQLENSERDSDVTQPDNLDRQSPIHTVDTENIIGSPTTSGEEISPQTEKRTAEIPGDESSGQNVSRPGDFSSSFRDVEYVERIPVKASGAEPERATGQPMIKSGHGSTDQEAQTPGDIPPSPVGIDLPHELKRRESVELVRGPVFTHPAFLEGPARVSIQSHRETANGAEATTPPRVITDAGTESPVMVQNELLNPLDQSPSPKGFDKSEPVPSLPHIAVERDKPAEFDSGILTRESPTRNKVVEPRVHIGRIDIVVLAPETSKQSSSPAGISSDMASRLYLRRL